MQNQEACGMHALRLSKQKPLQKSLYIYISYTFQNTWVPKNLSKILKESNMYCLYCQLNVLWYCLYVTYIILHNMKICPLPNAYSFLWGMSPSARLRRAPASLSASHRQKRWISIGQRKEKEESLNNVQIIKYGIWQYAYLNVQRSKSDCETMEWSIFLNNMLLQRQTTWYAFANLCIYNTRVRINSQISHIQELELCIQIFGTCFIASVHWRVRTNEPKRVLSNPQEKKAKARWKITTKKTNLQQKPSAWNKRPIAHFLQYCLWSRGNTLQTILMHGPSTKTDPSCQLCPLL